MGSATMAAVAGDGAASASVHATAATATEPAERRKDRESMSVPDRLEIHGMRERMRRTLPPSSPRVTAV
ncbi:hypothetical protein GCM10009860_12150 [Microbacterium mitrae]